MHDDLQENFHIIDFGASRMNNGRQLDISGNPFYDRPNGSLGLDLMTLCLSLVDWINSPYIGEDEAPHELLDLLWYPLWNFFKNNPTGRRGYHGLTRSEEIDISKDFLNPKGFHFLGTGGILETKHWPKYTKNIKMGFHVIQNYNKIKSGLHNCRIGGYFSVGNKIYYKKSRHTAILSTVEQALNEDWVTRKELASRNVDHNSKKEVDILMKNEVDIILFKYFGYAAADKSNLTGSIFRPDYILSKDAQQNLNFMHDMYNVYTKQVGTVDDVSVEDVNSVEDFVYSEEDVPAWLLKKEEEYQNMMAEDSTASTCVTMMMPQFRTFTFKK